MDLVHRVSLILSFLCSLHATTIPLWNIKLGYEQGPNVCMVEEVPNSKYKVWTDCKYWKPREICGQKPILRYECCEGYKRVPGTNGCIGVKPLKNILQTAKSLGAGKFVKYIEESGLSDIFTSDGSMTLFAPSDEAMKALKPSKTALLERYKSDRRNPLVMYHTIDKRLTSANFKADMLVPTNYVGHKLRLNKFSSKVETVNCANIVRKDHEATNGIVHIIDDVLDPTISSPRNLADIIKQDGRFFQLSKMLEESGMGQTLRKMDNPVTILAPSDEAFQKLPKSVLLRITDDNYARGVVVKNHVLSNSLCLPAILGKHKIKMESDEKISFDCDQKGVSVNEKKISQQITLARNGVLYMIDDVLIPNKAKSLLQLVEETELHYFLKLMKMAKLDKKLDSFGDFTIFAPTDEGILTLGPEKLQELQQNEDEAKKFISHHILEERIYTSNMANNEVIMSLDEKFPLRMQINRKSYGVDDALIEMADIEGFNGVLHLISKPLIPITNSWRDVLNENSSFSTFLQVLDQVSTEMPEEIEMEGYKTLFVPTNDAFQTLGDVTLNKIMKNTTYLSRIVKSHIAEQMITTESLQPGLQYYMETDEKEIELAKEEEKITVNGFPALKCDLMSKNGVLHIIDKVFLPDPFSFT